MPARNIKRQGTLPAAGACLASIRAGCRVRLVGIDGGCNLQGRLLALGLVRGAHINVITNAGGCPLLIGLGESRMTIGRGMAEKILVACFFLFLFLV